MSSDRPEAQHSPNLQTIGTRQIYESEHDMYRESIRKFYETEVAPFHSEWEKQGEVPRELWTKVGCY